MNPLITPALPSEAWAGPYPSWRMATRTDEAGFDLRNGRLNITASDTTHPFRVLTLHLDEPEARHALAALALHGQSFGFTAKDVKNLRETAEESDEGDASNDFYLGGYQVTVGSEWLLNLAARIEALLPPEAK